MSVRTTLVGTAKLTALALVLVASVAHAAHYAHPPGDTSDGTSRARGGGHGFTISGHIKKLYPGKSTKLVTTVRNPNGAPIRVKSIKAKVTGVAGCTADRLKIKPFKGNRYVGPGHTLKVKLQIKLRPNAPNGCQGARLRLTYIGKAMRA